MAEFRLAAAFGTTCGLVFATATTAAAHDIIPGVSGFPAQLLHPFVALDQLLCLIAAGLLAGRAQGLGMPRAAAAVMAGIALGKTFQLAMPPAMVYWLLPLFLATSGGLLAAAAPRLPRGWAVGAILALGFGVGRATYAEGPGTDLMLQALAAAMIAAAAVVTVLGYPLSRLPARWVAVPTRVAGAWVAAIALMVLAFSARALWPP